jgi:hypothetical protein
MRRVNRERIDWTKFARLGRRDVGRQETVSRQQGSESDPAHSGRHLAEEVTPIEQVLACGDVRALANRLEAVTFR